MKNKMYIEILLMALKLELIVWCFWLEIVDQMCDLSRHFEIVNSFFFVEVIKATSFFFFIFKVKMRSQLECLRDLLAK